MSLTVLSQSERAEQGTIHTRYLVDWLLGSNTLRLSDEDFRYTYGATTVNYESYLKSIDGLGEIVSYSGSPSNSEVVIDIFNETWSTYAHLSLYAAAESFNRSAISVYELRYYDGETFASDVRTCHFKGIVEEVFDITQASFKIRCSSRLFDKRNAWGLEKINRATYPYCAPEDDGQYRNIAYGSINNIPCRCVKTGAIDLLAADITSTATTITVQGVRRFEFEPGGSIQIGTEVIPYTTFTAATDTFSGCIRTNGVPHSEDDPVLQLVSAFVYEGLKHQVRSISKVSVDDYDVTEDSSLGGGTKILTYIGQSGSELSGYESKAMISIPWDITKALCKWINKTKDSHTHNASSGTTYYPTTTTIMGGTTDALNLRDWDISTYIDGWALYGTIINFHSSSYVENTYPVDYHDITVYLVFSKVTPVVEPIRLYWIDRDPATTSYSSRTIPVESCKFLTIMPGTYTDPIKMSGKVPRTVQWRTGGIYVRCTGSNDMYLRIHEAYITVDSPTGRIPGSTSSGGSGTLANLWDGDESTYVRVEELNTATRTLYLRTSAISDKRTINKITLNALFDSNSLATTWDLTIRYGEGATVKYKTLATIPIGTLLAKEWRSYSFECDSTLGFPNWILSGDGMVVFSLVNGSGATTIRLYEVNWQFEYDPSITPYEYTKSITSDSIKGGLHTAKLVVGDALTIDAETRADDASGTITGTAGALITRPDHVFRHLLVNLMGQSSSDIGSSFATSGTEYAASSYALAFLAHDISQDGQQLLYSLAKQVRSLFYEWGGQYHLKWWPDTTPTADFALESDDIPPEQFPVFSMSSTRKGDIANKITCFYGRDYRSKKRSDTPEARKLDPEAASKGFVAAPLQASYGAGDIEEELTLTAVRTLAHAQDVLDFELARKQVPATFINLVAKWRAIQVQPGQCFSLTDGLMGSNTYRLLEYRPRLEQGTIEIKGQKV